MVDGVETAQGEDNPWTVNFDALFNTVLMLALVMVLVWKAWESSLKSAKKHSASKSEDPDEAEEWEDGEEDEQVDYIADDDDEGSEHDVGEELDLEMEDLHFGLPRCRIRPPNLDPLPSMIRWGPEQFDTVKLDVARIKMGSYGIWVVQGMKSNRFMYAMKKREDIPVAHCVVVEPPPAKDEEDENENPSTYGVEIGKIQLIP